MRNKRVCIRWWLLVVAVGSVCIFSVPMMVNEVSSDSDSDSNSNSDSNSKSDSKPESVQEDKPQVRVKRGGGLTTTIQNRHQDVRAICDDQGEPVNAQLPAFPVSPFVSFMYNLVFCTAGSSYFTRYFIAIQNPVQMTNPYTIDLSEDWENELYPLDDMVPIESRSRFFTEATKAVFTTNPYTKLFSAYIDKLYSPNTYYWNAWGKVAVDKNALNSEDYPCGSGISFPHFIHAVAEELHLNYIDLRPMDDVCKFCESDYNIVGKTEHSISDIDYLSQSIGVSPEFLYDENYKVSSVHDAIDGSINKALSIWRKSISTCISDYDSGRIIWRKLQIRGLIDAGITFPYVEEEYVNVTLNMFRVQCYSSAQASTDKLRLFKQTKIALHQAYSDLTHAHIGRLQQIYGRDFLLLGYGADRPDETISESMSVSSTDCFDWSQPWIFPLS